MKVSASYLYHALYSFRILSSKTFSIMGKNINREEDLKNLFNKSINDIVELPVGDNKDYYNALSAEEFINLKKALSNINNIITLKTTLAFVDKLAASGLIDKDVVGLIKANINSQSANANGFDILWNGDFPFIAEVKCNIPVDKNKFGPAQLGGIYKDIISLSQGKSKVDVNVEDYNKFMVFLHCENIYKAIDNLKGNMPKYDSYYVKGLVDDQQSLNAIWDRIVIIKSDEITKLNKDQIGICVIPVVAANS